MICRLRSPRLNDGAAYYTAVTRAPPSHIRIATIRTGCKAASKQNGIIVPFRYNRNKHIFIGISRRCSMPKARLPMTEPEKVGLSSERLKRIGDVNRQRVDRGEIPGSVTMLVRDGKVAHLEAHGYLDVEAKVPMSKDTIFRIASTTKPVTTVALLMLYEEGRFNLDDPISKFIPAYKDTVVITKPNPDNPAQTMLAGLPVARSNRQITVHDCLTHTGGFASKRTSIAFLPLYLQALQGSPELMRSMPELVKGPVKPMRHMVEALARVPLNFHPGTQWEYGAGHDVAGVLVEIISGLTLHGFMKQRIFDPLGMPDTGFYVDESKASRLANMYVAQDTPGGSSKIKKSPFADELTAAFVGPQIRHSGAGGLVSTLPDYARFAQMLMNGGELDGTRLLSRKTVELMTLNHIGNFYINMGPGYGYGLGVYVSLNPAGAKYPASVGTFGFGGSFGTYFFVDPKERLVGLYSTQVMGGRDNGMGLPIERGNELLRLAYQAIID
jgi:CubicO group peptidase (beta-lactamase class C family)